MERKAQKYNVLFLDRSGGFGGPSTCLYYMLKHLSKDKFRPVVTWYFYNVGPDTQRIRELSVPVVFLSKNPESATYAPLRWLYGTSQWRWVRKGQGLLRFLLQFVIIELPQLGRLLRLLKREAIDLIVLNSDVHYHLVGALAARISGIPCICRKAGGIGEGKRLKAFLTPCVDLFIAISRATAADQLVNNPATKRLLTIYEGIDVNAFTPSSGNGEV